LPIHFLSVNNSYYFSLFFCAVLWFFVRVLLDKTAIWSRFETKINDSYVAKQGYAFANALYYSKYQTEPLIITLKNNKVYVGYVGKLPHPLSENASITISPIESGYRSKKLKYKRMNDYSYILEIFEELKEYKNKPRIIKIHVKDDETQIFSFDELKTIWDKGIAIDYKEILSVAVWNAGIHYKVENEI